MARLISLDTMTAPIDRLSPGKCQSANAVASGPDNPSLYPHVRYEALAQAMSSSGRLVNGPELARVLMLGRGGPLRCIHSNRSHLHDIKPSWIEWPGVDGEGNCIWRQRPSLATGAARAFFQSNGMHAVTGWWWGRLEQAVAVQVAVSRPLKSRFSQARRESKVRCVGSFASFICPSPLRPSTQQLAVAERVRRSRYCRARNDDQCFACHQCPAIAIILSSRPCADVSSLYLFTFSRLYLSTLAANDIPLQQSRGQL